MLEAQCSLIESGDGVSQQGDIIIVALPNHPWGTKDRTNFLIVQWEDALFESQLLSRRATGEEWPVISLPYSIMEEV